MPDMSNVPTKPLLRRDDEEKERELAAAKEVEKFDEPIPSTKSNKSVKRLVRVAAVAIAATAISVVFNVALPQRSIF